MERVDRTELLDDPGLPAELAAAAYRDLVRTHRWLGNLAALERLLREEPERTRRVLDIGCGQGGLLAELQAELGFEAIGFDLRPAPDTAPVRIVCGDALRDPLPQADVALAVCLVHHLSPAEIVVLIRNVARSSRRLVVLDLVRHRLPLALFSILAPPLLQRINVLDGRTSIRRAYTPRELAGIVDEALRGTQARVTHSVAPFYARQILDIRFAP